MERTVPTCRAMETASGGLLQEGECGNYAGGEGRYPPPPPRPGCVPSATTKPRAEGAVAAAGGGEVGAQHRPETLGLGRDRRPADPRPTLPPPILKKRGIGGDGGPRSLDDGQYPVNPSLPLPHPPSPLPPPPGRCPRTTSVGQEPRQLHTHPLTTS